MTKGGRNGKLISHIYLAFIILQSLTPADAIAINSFNNNIVGDNSLNNNANGGEHYYTRATKTTKTTRTTSTRPTRTTPCTGFLCALIDGLFPTRSSTPPPTTRSPSYLPGLLRPPYPPRPQRPPSPPGPPGPPGGYLPPRTDYIPPQPYGFLPFIYVPPSVYGYLPFIPNLGYLPYISESIGGRRGGPRRNENRRRNGTQQKQVCGDEIVFVGGGYGAYIRSGCHPPKAVNDRS